MSGQPRERAEEFLAAYLADSEAGNPEAPERFFERAKRELDPQAQAQLAQLFELYQGYEPLLDAWLAPVPSAPRLDFEGQGYSLGEPLGQGGMGEVFAALDPRLERRLALKRLRLPPGADPTLERRRLARFIEEARIAGRLEHPGIVPIHALGRDPEGRPFFTMRLVEGQNLAELLEQRRQTSTGEWSLTRLVGVLLRVAETLAFAHHAGVIHRDLKPANVMVGRFGETYVVDWGLARRLSSDAGRAERVFGPDSAEGSALDTQAGDVVGTPAYMAPEQALGDPELVGAAADVYALGALLYELLGGRPPYPGNAREALAALRAGPPPPLARLAPAAPGELLAIAERALAREPALRYPSMEALRDDLRAHLEGRVVSAYESGGLAELKKWTLRNRRLSAALALCLLAAGLAVLALVNRRAERLIGERFQDLERLADLEREAAALWPALPERRPALLDWLGRAEALVERRRGLLVRPPAEPPAGASDGAAWRSAKLAELARSVAAFAAPERGPLARVGARLATARAIDAGFGAERARQRLAALAPDAAAPPGLSSGALWPLARPATPGAPLSIAFLHLPSTALELLESGPAALEAAASAPPGQDPRLGVLLLPLEAPGLAPCLLAQCELTMSQWERLGGPPAAASDTLAPARPLSWNAAAAVLSAGALRFPLHAECLAAAEAGLSTPFWWGGDAARLPELEVVAQTAPARVGSRGVNPLGFVDLLGNLEEWCQEPSIDAAGQVDPSRRAVFGLPFYLPLEAAEMIWEARRRPFFYAVTDPRAETGLRPAAPR